MYTYLNKRTVNDTDRDVVRRNAGLDVREPNSKSHGATAAERTVQVRGHARRAAAGDQVVRRGVDVHTDAAAALEGSVQAAGNQVPAADQRPAGLAEQVQASVGLDQEQAAGREGKTVRSAGRGGEQDETAGEKNPGETALVAIILRFTPVRCIVIP